MRAIIKSAHEALAHAKHNNDDDNSRWAPPQGSAIKALRQRLGLSQSQFAKTYGIDYRSLQEWEQDRRSPSEAISLILEMINQDSDKIAELVKVVAIKQGRLELVE
jgi:putative transcriptional regulator